jgi:hypothetical protein
MMKLMKKSMMMMMMADGGLKDLDDSLINSNDNLVHELEEHLNLTDVPDTFHVDIKFVFNDLVNDALEMEIHQGQC